MRTIYSEDHKLQDGKSELIDGKLLPCFEMPRRAELVRARVEEVGLGPIEPPTEFGTDPLLRVHTAPFVRFLENAWSEWVSFHGDYDALPLVWSVRTFRTDVEPENIDGKLGLYALDAGTPITAGTWRAARASANVALTGAAAVASGAETAIFSLCRPPGHHAAADLYGGYCFLNNAAIAAQHLLDQGAKRVAILDVDYHHGNGTQAIFYPRSDVLFLSIHGDPKQEYPFYLGHADEWGVGQGLGYNVNYPLRWGSGFDVWFPALEDACRRIEQARCDVVVVSLGVDTFKDDPISQFRLDSPDYTTIGARVRKLGLPTLFVMEGGYAVEPIGINTVNVLTGFEGG